MRSKLFTFFACLLASGKQAGFSLCMTSLFHSDSSANQRGAGRVGVVSLMRINSYAQLELLGVDSASLWVANRGKKDSNAHAALSAAVGEIGKLTVGAGAKESIIAINGTNGWRFLSVKLSKDGTIAARQVGKVSCILLVSARKGNLAKCTLSYAVGGDSKRIVCGDADAVIKAVKGSKVTIDGRDGWRDADAIGADFKSALLTAVKGTAKKAKAKDSEGEEESEE